MSDAKDIGGGGDDEMVEKFVCTNCPPGAVPYLSIANLQRHWREDHANVKFQHTFESIREKRSAHQCTVCLMKFQTSSGHSSHYMEKHNPALSAQRRAKPAKQSEEAGKEDKEDNEEQPKRELKRKHSRPQPANADIDSLFEDLDAICALGSSVVSRAMEMKNQLRKIQN